MKVVECSGGDRFAGRSMVSAAVWSARVGGVDVPGSAERERNLSRGLVASFVAAWCGHPFQFGLPPFPQIALGLVAAFSCVETPLDAEPSGREVAQLGPGSPPAGGRGHDETGVGESVE